MNNRNEQNNLFFLNDICGVLCFGNRVLCCGGICKFHKQYQFIQIGFDLVFGFVPFAEFEHDVGDLNILKGDDEQFQKSINYFYHKSKHAKLN